MRWHGFDLQRLGAQGHGLRGAWRRLGLGCGYRGHGRGCDGGRTRAHIARQLAGALVGAPLLLATDRRSQRFDRIGAEPGAGVARQHFQLVAHRQVVARERADAIADRYRRRAHLCAAGHAVDVGGQHVVRGRREVHVEAGASAQQQRGGEGRGEGQRSRGAHGGFRAEAGRRGRNAAVVCCSRAGPDGRAKKSGGSLRPASIATAPAPWQGRRRRVQRRIAPSLSITRTSPRFSARIGCSILRRSPTTTQV